MYTGKVFLTNKNNTPFSLSNKFDNTFLLIEGVKTCSTPEAFCKLTNKVYGQLNAWKIANDNEEYTRLQLTDNIGNEYYLLAYKKTEKDLLIVNLFNIATNLKLQAEKSQAETKEHFKKAKENPNEIDDIIAGCQKQEFANGILYSLKAFGFIKEE